MKHLLFAIGLVATLASCSKKEEPAPEPMLSCIVEGKPFTFKSAPDVYLKEGYDTVPQTPLGDDAIYVVAETTQGQPYVQVTFRKPHGRPET